MTTDDSGHDKPIASSKTIVESGFFDAGTSAIEKIANVAEKKGLKVTSLAFGAAVILAIIGEFLSTTEYIPHHGEVIAMIMGGLLILIPVLLNELDYRWEIHANLREKELLNERLRIEADYQIALLEATQLKGVTEESKEYQKAARPK